MKSIFVVLLGFFGSWPLLAETDVEDDEESLPERTLVTYARGSGDYRDLFFEAEPGLFEPLRVLRGSRASPVKYTGPQEFKIFRRESTEDPEKPWVYYPVASTSIRGEQDRFLLLITPLRGAERRNRGDEKPEFNIAVIPELRDTLDSGNIAFFNGTSAQLFGVLGDRKILLDPGLSKPYSIGEFPPNEGVLVGLTVRYEDSLRPVFQNHLHFSANSRYLIVLLPPEERGSFQLVAFRLNI